MRGERNSGGRGTGRELYFVRNMRGRLGSGTGPFLMPSWRSCERRVAIVAIWWGGFGVERFLRMCVGDFLMFVCARQFSEGKELEALCFLGVVSQGHEEVDVM